MNEGYDTLLIECKYASLKFPDIIVEPLLKNQKIYFMIELTDGEG